MLDLSDIERLKMLELLKSYAMRFIGVPYRWGGDDPMGGYDCSGFVQEILAAFGKDPPGDQTSHLLWEHFRNCGDAVSEVELGHLAFYGNEKCIHVAIGIGESLIIEAGGGGSRTRTRSDAEAQNAYVRIRPHNLRNDLLEIIDPLW